MRKILFAISFLLVLACDKEIERAYLPEFQEERTISCSYYGYCHGCGIDMNGDLSCGFSFQICSGSQRAIVHVKPYKTWHESGAVRDGEYTTVVRTTTSCS